MFTQSAKQGVMGMQNTVMKSLRWVLLTGLVGVLPCGLVGCDKDKPAGQDAAITADASADAAATSDASPDAAGSPFELDQDRVFGDVAWLAHDDRGGREPGTAGNEAAMDYIETHFMELGLTPAGEGGTYRQAFEFNQWKLTAPTSLVVNGVPYSSEEYFTMSYSGSASAVAEVVFVGYGLTVPPFDPTAYPNCPLDPAGYDSYAGVDVTGRVALILRHGPDDDQDVFYDCPANSACDTSPCLWGFGYKTSNAKLHGAVAALVVQDYRHPANDILMGNIYEEYYQADVAGLFVHRGAVESALPDLQLWAATIDASGLPQSVQTGVIASINVQSELSTIQTENILGMVQGTDPTLSAEVIIVSGHLDHVGVNATSGAIFNGADDNASGTAVMMELARGAAHADFQPARSVLFAAWNAEEVGLIGSCYFVDNPTVPLVDTIAMFSVDMVGGGSATGVHAWNGTLSGYQWLMDTMQGSVNAQGWSYSVLPRDPMDVSDHVCFADAGVQSVMIDSIGTHDNYHTPLDDIDNVTADDLGVTAAIMWVSLETLALGLEDQYISSSKPSDDPVVPPRPLALHPRHRDR
jgi:Peptidase family M28